MVITPGSLDDAIFLPIGRIRQPDLYLIPLAELPVLHAQDHRQTEESKRGYKGYP